MDVGMYRQTLDTALFLRLSLLSGLCCFLEIFGSWRALITSLTHLFIAASFNSLTLGVNVCVQSFFGHRYNSMFSCTLAY